MNARGSALLRLLLVVLALGCEQPQRPAASRVDEPASQRSDAADHVPERPVPTGGEHTIPDVVTAFHRNAFEAHNADTKLGVPLGIVTLHDTGFDNGFFHVLALFERGEVGTWRQTPGKPPDQLFLAQLSPLELTTAKAHLASFAASPRASASAVKGMVMGVTARADGTNVTRFFDDRALPTDGSRWVGMLKARLEEENGR